MTPEAFPTVCPDCGVVRTAAGYVRGTDMTPEAFPTVCEYVEWNGRCGTPARYRVWGIEWTGVRGFPHDGAVSCVRHSSLYRIGAHRDRYRYRVDELPRPPGGAIE